MIGTDQEPAREILDRLNATLGEGKYEIRYEEGMQGVRAIVRLREDPPAGVSRETAVLFAPGAAKQQVAAVWQEAAERLCTTYEQARQQQQEQARQQAAAAPVKPRDITRYEGDGKGGDAPVPSQQPTSSAPEPAATSASTAAESRGAAELSGGTSEPTPTPPPTEREAPGLGARVKGALKGKGDR